MFKDGNKIYVKGKKVKGFIDSLDIEKIMNNECKSICKLCSELGSKCVKEEKLKCK